LTPSANKDYVCSLAARSTSDPAQGAKVCRLLQRDGKAPALFRWRVARPFARRRFNGVATPRLGLWGVIARDGDRLTAKRMLPTALG